MSLIIVTGLIAWAISQVFKVIWGYFTFGGKDLKRISWRLIWAGGMPSSHSALTVSVLVLTGCKYGLESTVFGLSFIITAITIYDRSRLNHIYRVFQDRYPDLKHRVQSDPVLKDLVGHTLNEILVGIAIGIIAGSFVFFLLDK